MEELDSQTLQYSERKRENHARRVPKLRVKNFVKTETLKRGVFGRQNNDLGSKVQAPALDK